MVKGSLLTGLLLLTLLIPPVAYARTPPWVEVVRLEICAHETRGEPDRAAAISPAGARGECQIMPGTARSLGFTGADYALHHRVLNRRYSRLAVAQCIKHGWGADAYHLAYCYHNGPYADKRMLGPRGRAYAKWVASNYAHKRLMELTRLRYVAVIIKE